MMDYATTLRCPSCGAPAPADSAQCAHCASRLAVAACPSCFGQLFLGSRFCPHCGAAAARREEAATERRCPRCRESLAEVRLGAARVEECAGCGGVWLDAESFERICSEREEQSAALGVQPLPGTVAGRPVPESAVRYVSCPECGKLMNRINFARISGVVVDVCKPHGTWLDAEEMRRIVEFIRGGGLDVARERERQRLEEERHRLQRERLAAESASSLTHPRDVLSGGELSLGLADAPVSELAVRATRELLRILPG